MTEEQKKEILEDLKIITDEMIEVAKNEGYFTDRFRGVHAEFGAVLRTLRVLGYKAVFDKKYVTDIIKRANPYC